MQYAFEIIPYTLHFHQPAGTSRGVYHDRKSWYVFLTSPEFPLRTGIGECAPLPDLSCDALPDYEQRLTKACEQLVLNGAPDYEALRAYPSILFGLETALRHLQTGTFALWDTPFSRSEAGIPINGLIWMGSKEQMLAQIEQKLARGFRCVKLKIGAIDFDQEITLLQYIRQRFSASEIELRLDANGAFSPKDALQKLERLSQFTIHSIEQPIRAGQWDIMADLVNTSPIPIALDEELIGVNAPEEKERLLEAIQPHYIILKPSLHGGFQGSAEWIDLAKKRDIGWWITSALESNIGLNAIAQWCGTLNVSMPQGLGTGQLFTNNIPLPLVIQHDQLWYQDQSRIVKSLSESSSEHDYETNRDNQILILEGIPYAKEMALQLAARRLNNAATPDWERAFFSFVQTWWNDSPTLTVKTSGSTGTPKSIVVEKERMMQSAMMTCSYLQLHHGDTALLCLPVDYIAGKMMVVRALVAGLNLYCVSPSGHPLRHLPDMPFAFAAMIPMQVFHSLHTAQEKVRLAAIHHCIIGGAPVDSTLEHELLSMPNSFYVTYGMTETLSHIAMRRLNGAKASGFYEPFPHVRITLSEEETLIIDAPLVADQVIETNDMARILEDGRFEILGRKDNVINSGGLKFQPEVLERKLHRVLSDAFVVTSVPDAVLGEKLVLLIERSEQGKEFVDLDDLKEKTRDLLSAYEQPKAIYGCIKLPHTPNGKIDRNAARQFVEKAPPVSSSS
jgi:o-succinylbenzoate synthase